MQWNNVHTVADTPYFGFSRDDQHFHFAQYLCPSFSFIFNSGIRDNKNISQREKETIVFSARARVCLRFLCISSGEATIVSPLKWNKLRTHYHDSIVARVHTYIYNCTFHLGSTIVAATQNARARWDCRQKFSRWRSAIRETVGKQKWWFCDTCARINLCKWRLAVREISAEVGIPYGTCRAFWQRIWTCDTFLRISFHRAEATPLVFRHQTPLIGRNGSELHGRHNHRWRDMGLWTLSGKGFDTDTITDSTTKHLNNIPIDSFKKCFQQWQNHWPKRIASEGAYFEGD
jgi:hypothetical protein